MQWYKKEHTKHIDGHSHLSLSKQYGENATQFVLAQPLCSLAHTKSLMELRQEMEEGGVSSVLYPLCPANHRKNSINSFFFQPINLNSSTFKTQEVLLHSCIQWTDQFSTSAYKLFHFPKYKQDRPRLATLLTADDPPVCVHLCARVFVTESEWKSFLARWAPVITGRDSFLIILSNINPAGWCGPSCGLMDNVITAGGAPPYTSARFALLYVSPLSLAPSILSIMPLFLTLYSQFSYSRMFLSRTISEWI